ncbi:MAG: hypothetical protein OHK0053_10670 [Microscillaceae bacterium]
MKYLIYSCLLLGWGGEPLWAQTAHWEKALQKFYADFEPPGRRAAIYKNLRKEAYPTLRFICPEDSLFLPEQPLAQIALIRHGQPRVSKTGRFSRRRAQQYIQWYDKVGVYGFKKKPFALSAAERAQTALYYSPLPRAQHTAEILFDSLSDARADSQFVEFARKIAHLPDFKYRLTTWLLFSRVFWLMGLNDRGIESFREARQRARAGAEFLHQASLPNERTVLVAHGFLNRYLRLYLVRKGWTLVRKAGSEYLGVNILVKLAREE